MKRENQASGPKIFVSQIDKYFREQRSKQVVITTSSGVDSPGSEDEEQRFKYSIISDEKDLEKD